MRAKLKPQVTRSKPSALEAALRYAKRGWPVFPLWPRDGDKCGCGDARCENQGKHPIGHLVSNGFKDATTDPQKISRWFRRNPDAGIGMPTGDASGLMVIDVDRKNGKDGTVALGQLIAKSGPLPETRTATTPSNGQHYFFKHPGNIRSGTDKLGSGLDVKADGGYVVLPPSHGMYQWVCNGKDGGIKRAAELPQAWTERLWSLQAPPQVSRAELEADPELIAEALAALPNGEGSDFDSWGEWNRVGMATFCATGGSEEGFRAFDEWSSKWPGYDAEKTRKRWEAYKRSPPKRIGAGTLFHLADEAAPGWRKKAKKAGKVGGTQTDTLLQLAEDAELFHTDDGVAYADIKVEEHRETWPIRSKGFKEWLLHRYFMKTNGAPNREALNSALAVLEAKARFEGQARDVRIRSAGHAGKLYVDLADAEWRAVEIDRRGWRVVTNPPVRFYRSPGMLPLPVPVTGGTVRDLQDFINIKNESEFVLLISWIVAALRDRGPYPILVLRGEEGTGKSTLVRIVRSLIDPNKVPLRTFPRNERDLYIAASNGYVLAFDNVSNLPHWMSDALCRLATGGGFATRALYKDQEEVLINAIRPIVLNGIEDFVGRPDLADRCIFINPEPIADVARRTEKQLNAAFEEKRASILGGLLDAVAGGLRELRHTHLDAVPRMADFARFATAVEKAVFRPGSFTKAYRSNRKAAAADVIEADMVADAVQRFLGGDETGWSGTAAELRIALNETVDERQQKSKSWPDNPRALRAQLQRAQAPLRKIGIVLTFDRTSRTEPIRITKTRASDRST